MFALTLVVRASMQICSQNVGHFRKWFLLNGLFKFFSHYFRNSHSDEWQKCRDTCMRYNMIKHSKRCVVEHPNCFTMTRSNLRWNSAEQLHHSTRSRTFFTDTQLYQTINMYEMFVLVQIFLCSEMTSNDALFVLLFLFRSLVRFQSRHILNLMILITRSK